MVFVGVPPFMFKSAASGLLHPRRRRFIAGQFRETGGIRCTQLCGGIVKLYLCRPRPTIAAHVVPAPPLSSCDPCYRFAENGHCRRGAACPFRHVGPSLLAVSVPRPSIRSGLGAGGVVRPAPCGSTSQSAHVAVGADIHAGGVKGVPVLTTPTMEPTLRHQVDVAASEEARFARALRRVLSRSAQEAGGLTRMIASCVRFSMSTMNRRWDLRFRPLRQSIKRLRHLCWRRAQRDGRLCASRRRLELFFLLGRRRWHQCAQPVLHRRHCVLLVASSAGLSYQTAAASVASSTG